MSGPTRIAAVAAALVGAVVLTGCTTHLTGGASRPEDDHLGGVLASESEVNTIMGVNTIRSAGIIRMPMLNDRFEPLSRPECIVVIGNAMDSVYRDTGYRHFRETQLSDYDDDIEVDQAIATFDSPKAAQALVSRTVDIWRRCGGETLTLSYNGGRTIKSTLLAVPSSIDSINVTSARQTAVDGYTSHRAIVAVDRMVIDLRVSDHASDDTKTVQLAKAIANRSSV